MKAINNLPHCCSINSGAGGSILNCGQDYVSGYGYFFFDYPNKQYENIRDIYIQYKFKFYKFSIHQCHSIGNYCESRNIIDNILRDYFGNHFGVSRDINHFNRTIGFEAHNKKCLFQSGFSESLGYGYSIRHRIQDLLQFDFDSYILADEFIDNEYCVNAYESNKRDLEFIFDCKLENINKSKLKIASSLLKERVKKPFIYE